MADAMDAIEAGRRAYSAGDWNTAFDLLDSQRATLSVDDLALLARCAWLLARVRETLDLSEEIFRRYEAEDRQVDAAMTALLLGLLWVTRGEVSVGSGWIARARRLLSDLPDGPAHGYLAYLDAVVSLEFGREADDSVLRLGELSSRFRDPALESLALAVRGLADLRRGETTRGFASLDEAMLPVIAGHVPAEWAGDIYCTVIHVCHELADFQRMEDWTRATEQWCTQFASEAIYRGICRVHRLELRGARGEWADVEAQLVDESTKLLAGNVWVAGEGFYQLGEIRRRRGDDDGAREAYAAARDSGIDPQPGEALLLLGEGRADEAWTSLAASLQGRDRVSRVRLLRAGVEIGIAAGRETDAAALGRELREAAADYGSPGFAAWSAHADGMLALSEGRIGDALTALQAAASAFRRDRQPYEAARVLALMSRAHADAGDAALAARDRAESHAILARLGALDDTTSGSTAGVGPLTAREAEVLECVAEGASNRDVATRLFISEKTVGRHLANIYVKLGVGSRTAAAAWWRDRSPAAAS